jgi:3',5'-cyclic AMP phosphodiesterase CpdA
MTRVLVAVLLVGTAVLRTAGEPKVVLPNRSESVKFAVLGDNGSGDQRQDDIAAQMTAVHRLFGYELVIMLGDNFYGSQSPAELVRKFDRPYRPLLDAGVSFHAAIGNHDDPSTINYPPLNMDGRRYYTYVRKQARFFVLDTNMLDAPQLRWFEAALRDAREPWKIAYFHHPIYGNAGRHGSAVDIRVLLEPLLVRYGIDVVFSGHDHVYERLKPQKGIHYFVAGSGGKLRRGDLKPSDTTAAGFDQEQAFMIVEIDRRELWFQTISRTGATVDAGTIVHRTRTGTD